MIFNSIHNKEADQNENIKTISQIKNLKEIKIYIFYFIKL